jgi:hypothetical protein
MTLKKYAFQYFLSFESLTKALPRHSNEMADQNSANKVKSISSNEPWLSQTTHFIMYILSQKFNTHFGRDSPHFLEL